ncbi:MAG: tetratricopeptide repeat protein [Planctomycetes bacterium]|nr:tetratricopeptide repeat protein [Planctomycetota bacterium]MBI3835313.1 tetratricopeptide repeat protein [Planctomycetota bacterium]
MSEAPNWNSMRARIAGKWQMPLFAFSILMLGGSILWSRPTPKVQSLPELIASLESLVSCGLNDRALDLGREILNRGDCDNETSAPVNLQLARARYARVQGKPSSLANAAGKVLSDYQKATSYGQTLTAEDHERIGRLEETRNEYAGALESYEKALHAGATDGVLLNKRLALISRHRLHLPVEKVMPYIDAVLANVSDGAPEVRFWALEQKLDLLEEINRLGEANSVLSDHESHFESTDYGPQFHYLQAWVLFKDGKFAESESILRSIRNSAASESEIHAMSGWLLGRVILTEGGRDRAEEALSFFEDVNRYHRSGPYRVASHVGMGEARALLDRQPEALTSFRNALAELHGLEEVAPVYRDVLRSSLALSAENERTKGNLRNALAYSELALELVDWDDAERSPTHLRAAAQIQSALAAQIEDDETPPADGGGRVARPVSQEARGLYARAASTYLDLSKADRLNEGRAADAFWQSAELFAKAGNYKRAIELLREYIVDRPDDVKAPRAALRIAQILRQAGRIAEAIDAYLECYGQFPQTLDGARALVPLAECYVTRGPDGLKVAEETLERVVNDSDVFTPQAPEFADALFLLGEIRLRQENFEGAVSSLEEAIARYPSDARTLKSRFLLANAYRRSALALEHELADAQFTGSADGARAELVMRFDKARSIYHAIVLELDAPAAREGIRVNELYYRESSLYEADCVFESGQYELAAALYEEAAATFREEPTALAAYVQIINCDVFLGKPHEARTALARATVLAETIPQEAFRHSLIGEEKKDWKAYFEWLGASGLF